MAAHEQASPWVPQANKMNDWGTCLHKSKMGTLFLSDYFPPHPFFSTRKGSSRRAAYTFLGFPLWRSDFITLVKKKKGNTSWFAPAITGWPRSVSFTTCGEVLHTRRTLVQKKMTFWVISLWRTALLRGLIHVLSHLWFHLCTSDCYQMAKIKTPRAPR